MKILSDLEYVQFYKYDFNKNTCDSDRKNKEEIIRKRKEEAEKIKAEQEKERRRLEAERKERERIKAEQARIEREKQQLLEIKRSIEALKREMEMERQARAEAERQRYNRRHHLASKKEEDYDRSERKRCTNFWCWGCRCNYVQWFRIDDFSTYFDLRRGGFHANI